MGVAYANLHLSRGLTYLPTYLICLSIMTDMLTYCVIHHLHIFMRAAIVLQHLQDCCSTYFSLLHMCNKCYIAAFILFYCT